MKRTHDNGRLSVGNTGKCALFLSLVMLGANVSAGPVAAANKNPPLDELPDALPLDENGEIRLGINELAAPRQHSCTILIGSPGRLVASTDLQSLGSTYSGGGPASATVITTNGSYSLTYEMPTAFTMMPGGPVPATTFAGTMSSTGATQLSGHASGVPVKAKRGTSELTMTMEATSAGGSYPAGNYTAQAILRCE